MKPSGHQLSPEESVVHMPEQSADRQEYERLRALELQRRQAQQWEWQRRQQQRWMVQPDLMQQIQLQQQQQQQAVPQQYVDMVMPPQQPPQQTGSPHLQQSLPSQLQRGPPRGLPPPQLPQRLQQMPLQQMPPHFLPQQMQLTGAPPPGTVPPAPRTQPSGVQLRWMNPSGMPQQTRSPRGVTAPGGPSQKRPHQRAPADPMLAETIVLTNRVIELRRATATHPADQAPSPWLPTHPNLRLNPSYSPFLGRRRWRTASRSLPTSETQPWERTRCGALWGAGWACLPSGERQPSHVQHVCPAPPPPPTG